MTVVVDASVVIGALIDPGEVGRWSSDQLLGESLSAPHLLPVECAHALRRAVSSANLEHATADAAHTDLLDLDVDLFGYRPLAHRIWELHENVTPYDAWYVALAEALDAPLVTLDFRLATAPGIRCPVITME